MIRVNSDLLKNTGNLAGLFKQGFWSSYTLFYYGTKNRLDFPPKLSESNFLGDIIRQISKLKNPKENQT